MKIKSLLFTGLCLMVLQAGAQTTDITAIRNQCRTMLLSDTAYATEQSYRLTDDVKYNTDAAGYYRSLLPDGSWKDLQYNRPDIPSAWPPSWHLYRVMLLCRAWHKNNDERYLTAIRNAISFFIKNDFKCNNWWQNQINVPYAYSSILLMLDKDATADEMAYLDNFLSGRVQQQNPTGQNKIWQHDIEARIALIHNNEAAFGQAMHNMQSVITISTGEGIQPDYSFQQHGAMLQFGNYGLHFVNSLLFWLKLTGGTTFAFEQDKQQILTDYCLNGLRWTVYKGAMDITAVGRQIREGFVEKRGDNIYADFNLLRNPNTSHCDYYVDGMPGAGDCKLAGNKSFWRSDYMVQLQSGQYMMSVKMHGPYVKRVESINGENQKGALLNDGVTLIQRSGNEYKNIEALWRWDMLPGTTTDTTWNVIEGKLNTTSNQGAFVGQASDGVVGAAAMNYNRMGLLACKSYFFVNDMLVALGAGISSADMKHVVTTVNQRFYNGKTGKQLKGEGWVWQDNIAYFFPDHSADLKWRIDYRRGDWGGVDKVSAGRKVTDSVITWYISQAQSDKYVYMVKPNMGVVATHKMAPHLPVKVLANTSQVQAIQADTTTMAVFYKPGSLYLSESQRLQADAPCILIIRRSAKGNTIYASDPTRKLKLMNLNYGGKSIQVFFPQGELAGSTVTVKPS